LRLQRKREGACGHCACQCQGFQVATTIHHEITPIEKRV
jgi:hypothetical protein